MPNALRIGLIAAVLPLLAGCQTTPSAEATTVPTQTSRTHPPVVAFGPAVAQQFRRPRALFAARPAMTQAQYAARNAQPRATSGPAAFPNAYADPEVVASFFGDRTIVNHSKQHGTQVTYIATDGSAHLWYPDNDPIVRGAFAVLHEPGAAEIDDPQEGRYRGQVAINYVCFRYAADSSNPATGHRGGGFECGSYAGQREALRETRKGDVFRLAEASAAPFSLGREPQTIAALQRRLAAGRR